MNPPRHATPVLPLAFVLLWSTGYIAGKFMVQHASALTGLVWRFGLAAVLFALFALLGRARKPSGRECWHSAVSGVLMLAVQFAGVYLALQWGASAGLTALVIGAMPLLVALLAVVGGDEKLRALQWTGLLLGVLGVALVVAERIDGSTPLRAWPLMLFGLVGISVGTLYQKRHASTLDPRVGLAVQNAAATLALLPFALWLEGFRFENNAYFYLPMLWTLLVNSVGGFGLLFLLIRRGAATSVAALFFLMPPVAAVFGHFVLGEHLTALKAAGFACAALGVWLVARPSRVRA